MSISDSSATVVAIGKLFLDFLQKEVPNWSRGFYRFEVSSLGYGANASCVARDAVFILDALEHSDFFDEMSFLGNQLHEEMDEGKPKFCVMLLRVDSDFNYKVDFEYADCKRWRIAKLNGASGIPVGIR